MKILKSIKKIARSPRLKYEAFNNLPPIKFHTVHGDNIEISNNGTVARRTSSFCESLVFSDRPVKIDERISLSFIETSTEWGGGLRFGFTSTDPNKFRNCLPKFACPDLSSCSGNWVKALNDKYSQIKTVFSYYVNKEGRIYYSINGEDRGFCCDGVDVNVPLWAVLDIYGNTCAVELIKPLQYTKQGVQHNSLSDYLTISRKSNEPLPKVYSKTNFIPCTFHETHGCNIKLSSDRCIAERDASCYSQGYVFSSKPMLFNKKLVIQILKTDKFYMGSLAFGLTSCNPSQLKSSILPDDSYNLLNRPEYWTVIKYVANVPKCGDELAFKITQDGEVMLYKNFENPVTLMHIDKLDELYIFFDLYGSTIKVHSLGYVLDEPKVPHVIDILRPNFHNVSKRSNDFLSDDGECSVCLENKVNCVLYQCGHLCMCYECAIKQWQLDGVCPICRAMIKDVIRTFKT